MKNRLIEKILETSTYNTYKSSASIYRQFLEKLEIETLISILLDLIK